MALPCAALAAFLSGQTTSPFVGQWRLNTAESKSDHPLGDAVVSIRKSDDGFAITFQPIRPAGNPPARIFPCILDGRERPLSLPDAKHSSHEASCRLIDTRTIERTVHHDKGKLVTTIITTVSTDGKIMNEVSTDKAEDGRVVKSVYVFDKQ
jgi:hypothetical protein